MVARGKTPGARGRGGGFDHDKAALNLMPLPIRERELETCELNAIARL